MRVRITIARLIVGFNFHLGFYDESGWNWDLGFKFLDIAKGTDRPIGYCFGVLGVSFLAYVVSSYTNFK